MDMEKIMKLVREDVCHPRAERRLSVAMEPGGRAPCARCNPNSGACRMKMEEYHVRYHFCGRIYEGENCPCGN